MSGRPMRGWLVVDEEGCNTDARLSKRIKKGIDFANSSAEIRRYSDPVDLDQSIRSQPMKAMILKSLGEVEAAAGTPLGWSSTRSRTLLQVKFCCA